MNPYLVGLRGIIPWCNEPLYLCWRDMHRRCRDPRMRNYKDYGGRGISVCQAWYDYGEFEKFAIAKGWVKGLCIDRIEVNGDYCPENVRFITKRESGDNKRNTRYITANCQTLTINQWAALTGMTRKTIARRKESGWDDDEIINGRKPGRGRLRKWSRGKNGRKPILITANGCTRTFAEWAAATGQHARKFEKRRRLGWSDHEIINGKPSSMNPSPLPNHAGVSQTCVSCGLPSATAQCAPCAEISSAFYSVFRAREAEDRSPRIPPACPGEVERGNAG